MNWLKEISEVYRTQMGTVDLCGVILFTDAHPHVVKVLRDQDYWKALNEASGDDWYVFSIKPSAGHYEKRKAGDGYAALVPVWREPVNNNEAAKFLEIESTEQLPCLIAFTRNPEGELLKILWKINERTSQEAYESISEGLKTIAEALKQIAPENRRYPEGIFNATEMAVSSKVTIKRIKNVVEWWKFLKDLLP